MFIITLWFVFSSPYLIRHKIPFPSTYLASNFAPWNSYGLYMGPVKNGAAPDVIDQIYPWKKLVIDSYKRGVFPLWNSYAFSGTPLLANYQSAALTPVNLLYFVLPFIDAWSLQVLAQPLLAALFMYFFARALKRSQAAALISSVAFMFCGFITTWGLYGTLGYAILFLPLALFSIEKIYETKKWHYKLLLALSVPLSFFSGHFQTSLYFLALVFAYGIFKYIEKKDLRLFIENILFVVFGILLCSPQLLPSIELYFASVRSGIFMKTEVIPWAYLPTFLSPDFFGNPVTRNDWFGHYAEWNGYLGLVPLILSFYSLKKRSAHIIFFLCSTIIVFLLAFQTPILDLLIALKIPVISTSAASRIIVLASFSIAVLAGFGLDYILADIKDKKTKHIFVLVGIFATTFTILWAMVLGKLLIPTDKVSIAFSNLKLPSISFAIFAILLLIAAVIKNKKFVFVVCAVLIMLTGFDLTRFATKWQPFDPKNLLYPEVPVSKFLSRVDSKDRVFGNFGQELPLMFGVSGTEGYDPLYIGRYGEFSNAAQDGNFHRAARSVAMVSKNGMFTEKIIDFLGVKYIIHKVSDGHAVWAFPIWDYPADQFKVAYEDNNINVFENRNAFPKAFLVGRYKVVADNHMILRTIFKKDTNLRDVAILESNPGLDLSGGTTGSVNITKYEPNKIEIKASVKDSSLLVLSDPFYPGWKADVDGKPASIYRADYAFRAVYLPKGTHEVTFTYDPDSFKIGLALALLGVLGVGGTALWKQKYQS